VFKRSTGSSTITNQN